MIYHTIGRRKRSIARIYMNVLEGKGSIVVNSKNLEKYFPKYLCYKIFYPIKLLKLKKSNFNIYIKVCGGGLNGQVEAIRLAISRALCKIDIKNRIKLKNEGLLTRDPREVERKKFGQKKARKKYQFSKR
ncbi:30S ribosomal protein S9 [Blattabacterium cuenoti]|uniref:30S ribosomal protein S9 n=1 Tax=Blattabacterium cuenoti TaxID=1653831 RepID=UPI00163C1CCF|nr:30S ribosomal protein S9 [Blattabacterium cuenoti]